MYGDGRNIRDWIYVQDNCAAIDFVAQKGTPGEIYNIAAKNERENLEIVDRILQLLIQREFPVCEDGGESKVLRSRTSVARI